MNNTFEQLKQRGLVQQTSNDLGVQKALDGKITVYAGFDPTATSLHVGNLVVLHSLSILQKSGHKVIVLVGSGTGVVGDPTDKDKSRKQLSEDELIHNADKIKQQIKKLGLIDFDGDNPATVLDNHEWLSKIKFIDEFLSEIAPLFSINDLVKLSTFEKRLSQSQNLSLLEFLYPVLQAYDYLHLFDEHGCLLQIGGNDQWANMVEGISLIRRKHNKEAFVLTQPLLVSKSGIKMGKTEEGAIWLDPDQTSPEAMYRELQDSPDDLVEPMLKTLTDLDLEEIQQIMTLEPRVRQERLAHEVVKFVHGYDRAKRTKDNQGHTVFELKPDGKYSIDDVLIESGLMNSKSEIRRKTEEGAVSINGERVVDPKSMVKPGDEIKAGKKKLLRIKPQ
jgi:tyrosyl-tRNA synthetase